VSTCAGTLIPNKYTLHGIQNFNKNLFNDFCICVFDLGGIKLLKLWALKNPLDLRTDPLQEGGDDEYHPTGLFNLGQWLGPFSFSLSLNKYIFLNNLFSV